MAKGGAPDPILKTPGGRYPMKAFLEVVIEGFGGDLSQRLIDAAVRLNDTDPLRRTIGRRLVFSFRKNFIEQHDPQGRPWAPLKKKRGKGRNPGSKALLDTLTGFESLDYELEEPDAVLAGFGKEAWYLKFHRVPGKGRPAREFMGIGPGDVPQIEQFVKAHAQTAFGSAA